MTTSKAALTSPGRALVVGAIGVLAVVAFAPTFTNGFVEILDDAIYVTRNAYVRDGLSLAGLGWAFAPGAGEATYWHPLTWLSLMLDVELFGVRAGPIHAVNLALHVVTAALLFLALERMTKKPWRSAAVALVFAVHPLQVESVAWAVERKTVLASAFGMGALLAYARYVERRTWGTYLAVVALLAMSLLAKPLFVTMPFLLLLLDVWPLERFEASPSSGAAGARRRELQRALLEKVPLLALALAAIALAARVKLTSHETAPLAERVANALTSYWAYAGKIAWPSALAFYYPLPAHVPAWRAALAALALAAVCAALALASRRIGRGPLVGWLWFLGTMVPMSGLVRSGLWPAMADRFVYLPIVGFLIAVVWTTASFCEGRRAVQVGAAVAGAAVCALAVRANVQTRRWGDQVILFETAARGTTDNGPAWANLGQALESQGRAAEARAVYEESIRLMPWDPGGYVNLGTMLHASGDLAAAEREYRSALALGARPGQAIGKAHYNLGLIAKLHGDGAGALRSFEAAIDAGFVDAVVYAQVGQAYAVAGRHADAERAFHEALRSDALYWRAGVLLANLLAATGRDAEARSALDDARRRAAASGEGAAAVDLALGAPGARRP